MTKAPSLGRGGPLTGLIPGRSEVKVHFATQHTKKGGDDPPFPVDVAGCAYQRL